MVLSFSDAAAQAVQGAACSLLALNDESTRWINEAYGLDGDFANIAGALRKQVCNESNPDTSGVGGTPPFTGGQCATTYEVTCNGTYTTGAGDTFNLPFLPDTKDVVGPIGGTSLIPDATDPFRERWYVVGNPNVVYTTPPNNAASSEMTITNIVRKDGQPDDCGDPPADIDEYNDYSETVSITYEDNSQTQITEDVDVTIGPLIVGIGGILYAPVTVGTGDITFNGNLTLSPELSVDLWPDGLFGGGGNTDNPAPDPSEPDPEPVITDDRRRIIGAIVTVTNYNEDIARVTQVAQGSSPDIFVPRTGNVSFYIDTPGGQAWTEPTPLRNVRQYVPCPAREGAVDVAVTEGTGFTLAVTPVYADLSVS
jgi:hypothetical protein